MTHKPYFSPREIVSGAVGVIKGLKGGNKKPEVFKTCNIIHLVQEEDGI